MDLLLTLTVAFRALGRNKLRAGLTVLGVVIGIAAVTTMVSIGESATSLVQGQLQSLGTNVLVVFPASGRGGGGVRDTAVHTLTAADAAAMASDCQAVLATTPLVFTGGQVIYGNSNWKPRDVFGVGPDYLTVRAGQLQAGTFFTDRDVTAAAKVCVLGHTVVAKLFQTANPLDQTIRVKNIPLKVVGVLERKGANIVGEDQDDIVLIPYTTVKKRLQGSQFDNVGAIAGISLVVGGIGIMNIMLVSVTERTREIGIRKAVGAKRKDILLQFLVEATVVSLLGGLIGMGLGIGLARLMSGLNFNGQTITTLVTPDAVLLSFTVSAAVGLFFGIYPAMRAARLNPIEALRYE